MDYSFLKPNSIANFQTIPDESVTGIAVKEDRRQNIMSSVVFEEGNRRTFGQVREWQGSSTRWVYTESTLKSDTKPATIAVRNRAAEVTLKDAVKEDKLSNGMVENAVLLLRGVIRTIKCHVESCTQEELWKDSPILPWLVEHAGSMLSRCQKDRDGRTPLERLHGKKPAQEFVSFGEKVLARPISSEPLNRMNPRYKFAVWLGVRNNSAECARGQQDRTSRQVGQRGHQQCDRSPVENC